MRTASLTKLLKESGINPLEYCKNIPDFYASDYVNYPETNITISNNVKTIGRYSFLVTDIQELYFEENSTCERIGSYAFLGCKQLHTVILPNSVKFLDNGAFDSCTSLNKFVLNKGILYIKMNVFHNCGSLLEINYDGTIEDFNDITISKDAQIKGKKIICKNGEILVQNNRYVVTKVV